MQVAQKLAVDPELQRAGHVALLRQFYGGDYGEAATPVEAYAVLFGAVPSHLVEKNVQRLINARFSSKRGYVYVFHHEVNDINHVKIGFAENVRDRMKQWERDFQTPGAISVLFAWKCSHAYACEQIIHALLGDRKIVDAYNPVTDSELTEFFDARGQWQEIFWLIRATGRYLDRLGGRKK